MNVTEAALSVCSQHTVLNLSIDTYELSSLILLRCKKKRGCHKCWSSIKLKWNQIYNFYLHQLNIKYIYSYKLINLKVEVKIFVVLVFLNFLITLYHNKYRKYCDIVLGPHYPFLMLKEKKRISVKIVNLSRQTVVVRILRRSKNVVISWAYLTVSMETIWAHISVLTDTLEKPHIFCQFTGGRRSIQDSDAKWTVSCCPLVAETFTLHF